MPYHPLPELLLHPHVVLCRLLDPLVEPSINHIYELKYLHPPPPPSLDKETKIPWFGEGTLEEWSARLSSSLGAQIRPSRGAKGEADPSSLHQDSLLVSRKELGTCGPGALIACY